MSTQITEWAEIKESLERLEQQNALLARQNRRIKPQLPNSHPPNQKRKRVAIPSVLVNAHLFRGAAQNTQATYRLRT